MRDLVWLAKWFAVMLVIVVAGVALRPFAWV